MHNRTATTLMRYGLNPEVIAYAFVRDVLSPLERAERQLFELKEAETLCRDCELDGILENVIDREPPLIVCQRQYLDRVQQAATAQGIEIKVLEPAHKGLLYSLLRRS